MITALLIFVPQRAYPVSNYIIFNQLKHTTMFSKRVWALIVLLNAMCVLLNIFKLLRRPTTKTYSYIGDDYPMRLPLQMNIVETTFDCSARYILNTSQSQEVWSKSTDTRSGGFVRLGGDYRAFAVSMYHQLHCMAALQSMLTNAHTPGDSAHMQHCLSYLRQFILCSADDTQEPPFKVAELKNRGCAPPFTRQCRDWTTLYSFSATNYLEFHEYKARNGSWTCRKLEEQGVTSKDSMRNSSMMAVGNFCDD